MDVRGYGRSAGKTEARSSSLRTFGGLVGALVCFCSCSEPLVQPRLQVQIDADSEVRDATSEVSVLLERQDPQGGSWGELVARRFTPESSDAWPLTHTVDKAKIQPGQVRGRYQLTVTARDTRDAVIAQARAIRDIKNDAGGTIRAHFETACLRPADLCGPNLTCRRGACVSALGTDSDDASTTEAPQRMNGAAGSRSEPSVTTAAAGGTDCGNDGARACATATTQLPLTCREGVWVAQPQCRDDERCKPSDGMCHPIARQCVGRLATDAFCDGDVMRGCSDPLEPPKLACDEHQRCVSDATTVSCACEIGFVADESKRCLEATECATGNGGCDPITTCSVSSGAISCSACPAGYTGESRTGCKPLLESLEIDGGTLDRPLSAAINAYKVRVPLLAMHVELKARGPAGTSLEIDSRAVANSTPWMSGALDVGDNPVDLAVVSASGVRNTYKLVIERAGAEEAFIKASIPGMQDLLGSSVAIDGDTIVTGAPYEAGSEGGVNGNVANDGTTRAGAVFVFDRKGTTWSQTAYVKAEAPAADEFFGASVAIARDLIAIGAPNNDPVDRPTTSRRKGSVYLFARRGGMWAQVDKISAPDGDGGEMFGFQVSMSANELWVGAPYESSQGTRSGAVYLFGREGEVWKQRAKLKAAEPVAESSFGASFATDGATLAVGAFQENSGAEKSGAAYVFTRGASGWTQQQRLQAAMPSRGATFGWGVAVLGDLLVIGAPRWEHYFFTAAGEAYVFQRAGDRWNPGPILKAPVPRESDYFGGGLILTPSMLILGANGDSSGATGLQGDVDNTAEAWSGAIFMYSIEKGQFVRNTYIKASKPMSADAFGASLAISGDTLVVGAAFEDQSTNMVTARTSEAPLNDSGAVYVFR